MPRFSKQSAGKLATCDDRLQLILNQAILVVDFVVLEGHRGKIAQDDAYAKGNSKLRWPFGRHNSLPSRAVDIAPYYPDGIHWKDLIAFGRLMGVVQCIAHQQDIPLRFGLDWNSNFQSVDQDPNESFLDAPHIELAG
jgi:peptidoglycan L-alanyl-D-glutamate endopeptidase CwlK